MLNKKIRIYKDSLTSLDLKILESIIKDPSSFINSSIKSFASKHNVSSSLITRLFQKIDLKGYKEAKEILFNPYQSYDLSSNNNSNYDIYIKSINQSLLYCINNLDMNKVDQIVNNILESKKIIIFSTGNTKNLSSIFFINLNLFKLNVYLSSSLYETNNHIIDENTTIICISLSGANNKIYRYLNMISHRPKKMILAISANKNFVCKEKINYHLYGKTFENHDMNTRMFAMDEKYIIFLIFDVLIKKIYKYKYPNLKKHFNEINTIEKV